MVLTPKSIREKFKGKATFRVVGPERAGYKLVVNTFNDKVFKVLKKMSKKLEEIFDVEIVNFI